MEKDKVKTAHPIAYHRTEDENRILELVMNMPFLTTRNMPTRLVGAPLSHKWMAQVLEAIHGEVTSRIAGYNAVMDELDDIKLDLKAVGRLRRFAAETGLERYPETPEVQRERRRG